MNRIFLLKITGAELICSGFSFFYQINGKIAEGYRLHWHKYLEGVATAADAISKLIQCNNIGDL